LRAITLIALNSIPINIEAINTGYKKVVVTL